jgi:phosphoserine phosphatase
LVSAADPIEAVVFDMDGVLVDTEHLWDEVRDALTDEWTAAATPERRAMMSSPEWSRYLHEVVGLREQPDVINAEVVRRMLARYETDLPVVQGAVEAVRQLAAGGYRLTVASSSNRELIDGVLRRLGLTELFEVTVSSEEVARGKPAPGRVPGDGPPPRRGSGGVRGDRGLRERHPRGPRRGHARDRVSEPALSAARGHPEARVGRTRNARRARRAPAGQLKRR